MSKCLLYVFSGTGNTFLAASFIKDELTKLGYQVDIKKMEGDITPINIDAYDYIGIGFPIYGFNPPQVVMKYAKLIEKAKEKKKLFIFRTSGEPLMWNDIAAARLVKRLRKKNLELIIDKHLLMPYNIMFRYKDEVAKQLYLYLKVLCQLLAIQIDKEEKEEMKYSWYKRPLSFVARLVYVVPYVNAPIAHVNKKKCTNCELCIKACPTKAMHRNKKGKIKINHHCTVCMRCSMYCPTDAVRFGILSHWRVNGRYDFKNLEADPNVNPNYINKKTKGFFKLFRKYFKEQNALLRAHNIPLPIEYKEEEVL